MAVQKSAIIDIGSNTIRLVIYQYSTKSGLKELENIKAVARLRNYINDDGILVEEGIQLLQNLLKSFKEMLVDYGIDNVRTVATASIRQAKNGEEIILRMKEIVGIEIELLSEEEEAYYGYFAVAHTISTPSAITIDMGGGSTEITLFENKELKHSISLPFGSVSLKKQFMHEQTLSRKEHLAVFDFAEKQFSEIEWLKNANVPVVGIGGSARNMAKLDQSRKNYPLTGVHQYRMSYDDFLEINDEIAGMTFQELKKLDGLSSDRADIIAPVCEVFSALMHVVGSRKFQFSRKGLREGLVMSDLLKEYPDAFNREDVFMSSAAYLASEFGKAKENILHHGRLSELLYRKLCLEKIWTFAEGDIALLKQGAEVFLIGEYLEPDSASQHTFYLLSNRSINGLNHKERLRLALMASYKNKDSFYHYLEPFEDWFSKEEIQVLIRLASLLKFTYALDASKRSVIYDVQLDYDEAEESIHFTISTNGYPLAEEYQANRQKKHFERVLRKEIVLHFI